MLGQVSGGHLIGLKGKANSTLTMAQLTKILENTKWRYRGKWFLLTNQKLSKTEALNTGQYEEVELPHGPVISIELLDKVSKKLSETYDTKKRTGKNYIYLLSGILEYEDGTRFSGDSGGGKKYRYYRNKENEISIQCKDIDNIIFDRLRAYLTDNNIYGDLLKKAIQIKNELLPERQNDLKAVEQKLDDLLAKDRSLQEKLLKSSGSDPTFITWLEKQVSSMAQERGQLEVEKDSILREIQRIKDNSGLSNIHEKMQELIGNFDKLSDTQKRDLIGRVFKRVVVKSNNELELHIYGQPPLKPTGRNRRKNNSDSELNGRG